MSKRCYKAGALLVAGSLLAGPAIAATITPTGSDAANLRLIELARAIGEQGTNVTTWNDAEEWRWDPATGIREVRLTWPRDAVTLPFNLFSHAGAVAGVSELVEGAGEYRLIVPGDAGTTTIRVHNDGPTAGRLTARFAHNELHNLTDRGDDPAYDHLFINGVAVSTLLAEPAVLLGFAGARGFEGSAATDADGGILIPAGDFVDLPFDWSFFAGDENTVFGADSLTGVPHNIGNLPHTQADFQLHLDISGEVTQLSVFKAIEGPGQPAAFAGLTDSDWGLGIYAIGHVNDAAGLWPSEDFSGLYQTAAMARGEVSGLLVDPARVYTAVVTSSLPEFELYQNAALISQLGTGALSSRLATSEISVLERDMFADAVGTLQCVLLSPFVYDGAGGFRRSVVSDTAWADGPEGGRYGYVSVPADHHAVCEKVSRTATLQVEMIVNTYDAAGNLIAGALPSEWQINITPVGGTADLAFATDAVGAGSGSGASGGAAGGVVDGVVGNTATSEFVRIRPDQQYRVDLIAPPGRITDGYELVDLWLTPLTVATESRLVVGSREVGSLNAFAAGDSANLPEPFAAGTVPTEFGPTEFRPAGFVPFGTTLAAPVARVVPEAGVTASWVLDFDQLSASTITFVSDNYAAVTGQPSVPDVTPGRPVVTAPAHPALAQTGADIALMIAAFAVLAGGAGLLIASACRRTRNQKAEA